MNNQWLMRTRTLLGDPAMEQLQNATVAVLGLGGVGGTAAEAVCRMGVGRMILIDNDSIDSTNCNRQLFATAQTVGQSKCLAAKERLLSINPDLELICHQQFFLPENSDFLFEQQPDLILDAIDTVTSKLYLAQQCSQRGTLLVSCLGTGNRLDPSLLRWGDISQTSGCGCPLARVMRRELKNAASSGRRSFIRWSCLPRPPSARQKTVDTALPAAPLSRLLPVICWQASASASCWG